jgi:DNA-binding winged helix-turn-helix (wHTH) protein
MIVVLSSSQRERAALIALGESRRWPCRGCDSVGALRRSLRRIRPKIIVTRHRLSDGYSDDVFAAVAAAGLRPSLKIFVLLGAGAPPALEARQIALGADWVQRDPVRADVLLEFLARYLASGLKAPAPEKRSRRKVLALRFAGAIVDPVERTLLHEEKRIALTPREVQLVELLCESAGDVVSYDTLYNEILGRRFSGESANMRVLLNKLTASFRAAGLSLRTEIDVIPKMGYRYRDSAVTPER